MLTSAPAAARPVQVVGLGQCSWDLLARIDQFPGVDAKTECGDLLQQGGGPVATALVTLARLGVASALIGRVGDDHFGHAICAGLHDEGVDCQHLDRVSGARSQLAFITADAQGRRNIFWTRDSCGAWSLSSEDRALIASCRVLHLDGLQAEAALAAAQCARRSGVTTVLDGGSLREGTRELLGMIDHPVVSARFARQFAPQAAPRECLAALLAFGGQAATLTDGARGSWTLDRSGQLFHQPAFAVAAVDTTGCGDVFHGGYIYGLLQNWPASRSVRFAAACAALKTRALGGRTAIPRLAEVETLLQQEGA